MTPLAVLRAQAESLDNPACAADLLEEIDQMVEMARQLLELAELDALSGPPTDPVDLGRLAEDVAAKLAGPAIEAGIEPRVVVEDAPVIVPGCAKGLRSALENLVKNALRHARGASVVEIRVQAPGRISVIDDGPGVPERDRARIFDRFYRTGASGEAGRGLGLAIVRQIVETHRGTVAVHDGPGGRGAAFVIDLPSFDARASARALSGEPGPGAAHRLGDLLIGHVLGHDLARPHRQRTPVLDRDLVPLVGFDEVARDAHGRKA